MGKQNLLRFVVAGALNTGASYLLYLLLRQALPYQVAYAVAYVAGVVFSYWLNAKFVFNVPLSWRGLLAYPLVYLVQYAASAILLGVLVERVELSDVAAPLIVSAIMIPLTFLMSRWILLRT